MAAAPLVISNASGETPVAGQIFTGLSFFLLQRIPDRQHYLSAIQSNGGRIVKLEDQADHVIADHVRKDAPPDSVSWKFIHEALRTGALPDISKHRIARVPTAIYTARRTTTPKTTRTPFTQADDVQLKQWVEAEVQRGGHAKGNEIYKRLEALNPRHSYHAWRDRYIKRFLDDQQDALLAGSPGQAVPVDSHAPSSTDAQIPPPSIANEAGPSQKKRKLISTPDDGKNILYLGGEAFEFAEDDVNMLVNVGKHILKARPEAAQEMWSDFEQLDPRHSGAEWALMWEKVGLPAYRKNEELARRFKIAQRARNESLLADGADSSSSRESSRSHRQENAFVTSSLKLVDDRSKSDTSGLFVSDEGSYAGVSARPSPKITPQNDRIQKKSGETPRRSATPLQQRLAGTHGHEPIAKEARVSKLSAANLANFEEKCNGSRVRGTDLPQDDESKDQTYFATYLQSTLGVQNYGKVSAVSEQVEKITANIAPSQIVTHGSDAMANAGHVKSKLHPYPFGEADTAAPRSASSHLSETHAIQDVKQDDDLARPSSPKNIEDLEFDLNAAFENHFDVPPPDGDFDFIHSEEYLLGQTNELTLPEQHSTNLQHLGQEAQNPHLTPAMSSIASSVVPTSKSIDVLQRKALETQDIMHADLSETDFTIPPFFSEAEEDEVPYEFKAKSGDAIDKTESSVKANMGDGLDFAADEFGEFDENALESWIALMNVRGFSEIRAVSALRHSSMRPDLAALVLLEERSSGRLPNDVPGIWSDEDDRALEGTDGKLLEGLDRKHGGEEVAARMHFLAQWRDLA